MFSNYGDDRWFRREWKNQCDHKSLFGSRCQGVEGHDGPHWHYEPNGSLHYDYPKGGNIGSSITPPDHKDYIPPADMQKLYYMSHYEDSEVLDPDELARIKAGDLQNGESLTQPVDPEMKDDGYLID